MNAPVDLQLGSRSRAVLAQAASAHIRETPCKEQQHLWNVQETAHAQAATSDQARDAAQPLLDLCAACPLIEACREWAALDRYTGIAAGQAWVDGSPRPLHWLRNQRIERARSAARADSRAS